MRDKIRNTVLAIWIKEMLRTNASVKCSRAEALETQCNKRQRKTISRMKGIKSVENYWKFMGDK